MIFPIFSELTGLTYLFLKIVSRFTVFDHASPTLLTEIYEIMTNETVVKNSEFDRIH